MPSAGIVHRGRYGLPLLGEGSPSACRDPSRRVRAHTVRTPAYGQAAHKAGEEMAVVVTA